MTTELVAEYVSIGLGMYFVGWLVGHIIQSMDWTFGRNPWN
jgi:hypothetical protein